MKVPSSSSHAAESCSPVYLSSAFSLPLFSFCMLKTRFSAGEASSHVFGIGFLVSILVSVAAFCNRISIVTKFDEMNPTLGFGGWPAEEVPALRFEPGASEAVLSGSFFGGIVRV